MSDAVLKLIEAVKAVLPKLHTHEIERGKLEFALAEVERQQEQPQPKEIEEPEEPAHKAKKEPSHGHKKN